MNDKEITTLENYLALVRENGFMIRNVPEEFMTEDMCLEAVRQEGHAIELIPQTVSKVEKWQQI